MTNEEKEFLCESCLKNVGEEKTYFTDYVKSAGLNQH